MNKFYKEQQTGNIFSELSAFTDNGTDLQLKELEANTADAAQEKHVPVVDISGNKVEVYIGTASHPMQDDHFITGIYLETKLGSQYRRLKPGEEPKATFLLPDGDEFVAAYEYCNLHGLWKA